MKSAILLAQIAASCFRYQGSDCIIWFHCPPGAEMLRDQATSEMVCFDMAIVRATAPHPCGAGFRVLIYPATGAQICALSDDVTPAH